MRGTLVFDNLNDIVYLNCCEKFVGHVKKLAAAQGLVASEHSTPHGRGKKQVDPNILIQLFSPLVTSQRFMREQFGNPYNSVQCEDGTNIVFQEFMGFLFMRIGIEEIAYLKRVLGITITFVTYLCGPDVSLLKHSGHAELVDNLLALWSKLYTHDQAFMFEAMEQINVKPQINATIIKSLKDFSTKLQNQLSSCSVHALIFLETKLLSWFSSRGAVHLSSVDLLFLSLLCQRVSRRNNGAASRRRPRSSSCAVETAEVRTTSSETCSVEGFDDDSSAEEQSNIENIMDEQSPGDDFSVTMLLKSAELNVYIPQLVHIAIIQPGIYAVFICEPSTSAITSALCTALQLTMEFHGKHREHASDKILFDQIETLNKKILDLLKKQKNLHIRSEISVRWDRFKSGFQQYMKTKEQLSVQTTPLVDVYREAFRTYYNWNADKAKLKDLWRTIKTDSFWKMFSPSQSLDVRNNNLTKYLEDFPGLVHFVYVDRNRHMVTTPSFDYRRDDSIKLTKTKIWGMVKFAREHMHQGHFSLMWKDTAFNYAYFLWFEDMTGTPIRGKQVAMPWENYPIPGIMCGDFYKRVVSDCFPGTPATKIRCLELYCIHLGLATSSCVLEHSKRLATNISDEMAGCPTADLL